MHSAMACRSVVGSSSFRRSPPTPQMASSLNNRKKPLIPMPPLNPNDPFLSKLATVAANAPEPLKIKPSSGDNPPYLDLFDNPKLMATPAQVERAVSYNEHRPTKPPPDLPSLLLNGRIVYIGMPLVPAVTELVIAELLYLQWMDPKEPIYLYINSTGTTRDDGETVGMETEGFAIYDAMMQLKNEIQTVAVGAAIGQACLLLAAGKKGRRFMMPHAKAMIQQPRIPSSGQLPASDVIIRAKEVIHNRDTLVKLIARHTGNPLEEVSKVMQRPYYMDSVKAQEFGVIDKVISPASSMCRAWCENAFVGSQEGLQMQRCRVTGSKKYEISVGRMICKVKESLKEAIGVSNVSSGATELTVGFDPVIQIVDEAVPVLDRPFESEQRWGDVRSGVVSHVNGLVSRCAIVSGEGGVPVPDLALSVNMQGALRSSSSGMAVVPVGSSFPAVVGVDSCSELVVPALNVSPDFSNGWLVGTFGSFFSAPVLSSGASLIPSRGCVLGPGLEIGFLDLRCLRSLLVVGLGLEGPSGVLKNGELGMLFSKSIFPGLVHNLKPDGSISDLLVCLDIDLGLALDPGPSSCCLRLDPFAPKLDVMPGSNLSLCAGAVGVGSDKVGSGFDGSSSSSFIDVIVLSPLRGSMILSFVVGSDEEVIACLGAPSLHSRDSVAVTHSCGFDPAVAPSAPK